MYREVAPYVGAWVETKTAETTASTAIVAPYVGAWVETRKSKKRYRKKSVAPYVGAWVETRISSISVKFHVGRTLRGCVG